MASAIKRIFKRVIEIETALVNNLIQRFSPEILCPALVGVPKLESPGQRTTLQELLQESVLWAVPKKKRSAHKVRERKFGVERYTWKPLVAKKNLVVCSTCRQFHEPDTLCGTCYNNIIQQTKAIQDEIMEHIQYVPIEEEIIVLQKKEDCEKINPEYWKGKRIIEAKKELPKVFTDNLLQRSTQPNATTTEIAEVPHRLEYK